MEQNDPNWIFHGAQKKVKWENNWVFFRYKCVFFVAVVSLFLREKGRFLVAHHWMPRKHTKAHAQPTACSLIHIPFLYRHLFKASGLSLCVVDWCVDYPFTCMTNGLSTHVMCLFSLWNFLFLLYCGMSGVFAVQNSTVHVAFDDFQHKRLSHVGVNDKKKRNVYKTFLFYSFFFLPYRRNKNTAVSTRAAWHVIISVWQLGLAWPRFFVSTEIIFSLCLFLSLSFSRSSLLENFDRFSDWHNHNM